MVMNNLSKERQAFINVYIYTRSHGREEEVEELYEQLFDTRLLVLYGEQAVGKTSLVQCGLANRIKPARYQGIIVRRFLALKFNYNRIVT